MLPPETTNAAILFLIQAGSLAASELGERWKLRRKKEEKAINLDEQATLENEGPDFLSRLSIDISSARIDQTRRLIEEKQERVFHWQRSKVLAEKDYDLGRIPIDVLVAKKEDLDKRIRSMMQEIEKDILSLGVMLEKETL